MIRKYIIVADDSIKGFDEEIAKLEREWGAEEIESCDDCISREMALKESHKICIDGDVFDVVQVETLFALPSVTPQPTRWIPCSERMPEDEQEILFSTKTGRVHSGKYHDDDSANQWYSHRDKCRAWNNVVTAWMPLPQPYKAESEDKE